MSSMKGTSSSNNRVGLRTSLISSAGAPGTQYRDKTSGLPRMRDRVAESTTPKAFGQESNWSTRTPSSYNQYHNISPFFTRKANTPVWSRADSRRATRYSSTTSADSDASSQTWIQPPSPGEIYARPSITS